MKTWFVTLIATSWLLLALIIVLTPAARSGLLNIVVSIDGLLGAAAAASFLVSRRSLLFTLCIGAGAVILIVFAVQWALFIHAYVTVDPRPNALIAAWLYIKGCFAVPTRLIGLGYPLRAFVEFYWSIGMALLQFGIVAFAVARTRNHLNCSWRVAN